MSMMAKGLYSVKAHFDQIDRATSDLSSDNLSDRERTQSLTTLYKDSLIQQAVEVPVRDALSTWRVAKDKALMADDRIELSEALTEAQDVIADLFQQVTEIPDLDEPEEGRKNKRDAFIGRLAEDANGVDRDAISKKYSVKELKAMAKASGLSGYSRLGEGDLIDLLLGNGVKL